MESRYIQVTKKPLFTKNEKSIYFSFFPFNNGRYWRETLGENDILFLMPKRYLYKSDVNQIKNDLKILKKCVMLCNEPETKLVCNECGVYSAIININAFLNENQYKIDPEIKKKYNSLLILENANYNFDIDLISGLKNIAILCNNPQELKIPEAIKEHSHILNYADFKSVYEVYNSAKCTLALALDDGSGYQSCESLLCGIPVVSIPSVGGRHLWYHYINSIISDVTSESVAESVWDCGRRRFNPQEIRNKQITLMNQYQQKFCKILQMIYRLNPEDAETIFILYIKNRIFEWTNLPQP